MVVFSIAIKGKTASCVLLGHPHVVFGDALVLGWVSERIKGRGKRNSACICFAAWKALMKSGRAPSALLSHPFPRVVPWIGITKFLIDETGTKTLSRCACPGVFSWKASLAIELEFSATICCAGLWVSFSMSKVVSIVHLTDSCARDYPELLETPRPRLQTAQASTTAE